MRSLLTVSIAITLLLYAAGAFAQMDELRNSTPGQRAALETAFMKRKLNLTQSQVKQVLNINQKYAKEMDPVIKGNEGKLEKARQTRAIKQAKDNELKTVLSGEQYQKYLASKEEMRQRVVEKIKEKRHTTG